MEKKLLKGNNLELLKTLEPNSVDSVVTDAPYGLSFMNKKWDYDVPSVEFWTEVYRVLKPGGHILCFGGTRTYHRMVVNIEDAGFEIRDCIQWIYGSGFPKSLNVGKTIDEYKGWGTGLKPANEPIVLARKPIEEDTIAKNVLEYGTGGINIDGCRIGSDIIPSPQHNTKDFVAVRTAGEYKNTYDGNIINNEGRFPANVILECTCDDETHTNPECPCYIMDEQSGESVSTGPLNYDYDNAPNQNNQTKLTKNIKSGVHYRDKGGASRFFYQAKVSKKERNIGTDKNNHPTVKPINLLTYLVRMITPPNGVVLDAYMGSGSTGIAALLEGFKFIGMEMDDDYFNIAEARINNYEEYRKLLK